MSEILNHYRTLSIASIGPATLPKETKLAFEQRITNYIDDIDGTKRINKYEEFYNKKPLVADNTDDYPRRRVLRGNRPESFKVDDIPGARKRVVDKMVLTKRRVNPLEPIYDYPKHIERVITPTKFLRDNISINDVEGSCPKPVYHGSERPIMKVDDIDGTRAKQKIFTVRDNLNKVDDVGHKPNGLKTQRSTNILEPRYTIYGIDIVDDPRGSKPRKLKPFHPDTRLLVTQDIPGATAGWIDPDAVEVRNPRDLLNTRDIEGAQADTLKHTIVTKRFTDPIQPVYHSLDGGGTVLTPVTEPLISVELLNSSKKNKTHTNCKLSHSKINSTSTVPETTSSYLTALSAEPQEGLECQSTTLTQCCVEPSVDTVVTFSKPKNQWTSSIFATAEKWESDLAQKGKISNFNIYDKSYHRSNPIQKSERDELAEFISKTMNSEQHASGNDTLKITNTLRRMEVQDAAREIRNSSSVFDESGGRNISHSLDLPGGPALTRRPVILFQSKGPKISMSLEQKRIYKELRAEVDSVRQLAF